MNLNIPSPRMAQIVTVKCVAYYSRPRLHNRNARNGSLLINQSNNGVKICRTQKKLTICAAAGAMATQIVRDIMTVQSNIITCTPSTSLDEALEILVENQITGLPVVDSQGVVVGVVSDFDLLALEGVSASEKAKGLFPEAGTDWSSFFEVQKLVEKNAGKSVGDVMTSDPVCVRQETSIEDAANLLLRKRIRRLPVVDANGRLLGMITRSNIIRAAWEARKRS